MRTRRILMSLSSVIICAVSVGVFKIAAPGVDPFQSLVSGPDKLIPIPFGTLYVIVNLLLLTFSLVVDRHNIGIATFIILFLPGYITRFTYDFLQTVIVNPSMIVRGICLIIGIVVICVIIGVVLCSCWRVVPLVRFLPLQVWAPLSPHFSWDY